MDDVGAQNKKNREQRATSYLLQIPLPVGIYLTKFWMASDVCTRFLLLPALT
ncbi:MAG: hypothetical protein GX824_09095 [Clostridiales bacterium]|nr:hypothetical protein [Clostridiales bacterium]